MLSLINGSGSFKLNIFVAVLDGIVTGMGFAVFPVLVCDRGMTGFWYGEVFPAL